MPAFITIGRVLFAAFFIYAGIAKLLDIPVTIEFMTSKVAIPDLLMPYALQLQGLTGMTPPKMLVIAAAAFELLCGLMIALNFGARFAAILLIFFLAATIYYFHDFWNPASPPRTVFDALKGLSMIGALFMIAGYGRTSRTADPAYDV